MDCSIATLMACFSRSSLSRTATCIAAVLLAACADLAINNEYLKSEQQIVVPTALERTAIKDLIVRFHPTDPSRASVIAGTGSLAEAIRGSHWDARIDEFRAIYQQTLLEQLRASGRDCMIEKAFPYPDVFMFDFQLACE